MRTLCRGKNEGESRIFIEVLEVRVQSTFAPSLQPESFENGAWRSRAVSQFVCTNTLGSRRRRKRKEKRKEKIKISVFTLVHLLHPSSSSTVTRNHNHANIAHSCCIKECVEDAVGTRSIQWSPIPKPEHKGYDGKGYKRCFRILNHDNFICRIASHL